MNRTRAQVQCVLKIAIRVFFLIFLFPSLSVHPKSTRRTLSGREFIEIGRRPPSAKGSSPTAGFLLAPGPRHYSALTAITRVCSKGASQPSQASWPSRDFLAAQACPVAKKGPAPTWNLWEFFLCIKYVSHLWLIGWGMADPWQHCAIPFPPSWVFLWSVFHPKFSVWKFS